MKLSELVFLKNELDAMSAIPIQAQASYELNKITFLTNSIPTDIDLNTEFTKITEAFRNFEGKLEEIKISIQRQIADAEKPWFQESYTLYESELKCPAQDILSLRASNTNPNVDFFKARLNQYADWHHSAIIIRPGTESFIEDLVAFDPLYLVDLNHEYLAPAIARFNELYQSRLRTYTVTEDLNREILEKIPNNQFGFCFAYNYFNFRPFEVLKKYLVEIHNKLKPGGVFIMTFNDCDRGSAVNYVEQYYSCYTPGYLVRELVVSMGFEIAYSFNDDGPTTWLELKKPGKLTSIKGGQSLGKIVQK